ncbi:MAG: NADH-quinone oxidoreductase subunit [Verrucomicrobiota bacterium]|jgi:NADH-quinone oxidoreductase subunit N
MIPPPAVEIAVLVLGMLILMFETFAPTIDKRFIGLIAIIGLLAVLAATFRLAPGPATGSATGFWSFYAADPLAIFFKRFSLVTTIFVLVMMIDYAPVVRASLPAATNQAGFGEFITLPIFTCAGLMYLVSAIDLVMIFVSLELVTISFYVLVSLTRRNPVTLEAGVKYLILSAMSTGFIVYGITWIFGVTNQTNLQRIGLALSDAGLDRTAALFGVLLLFVGLGFKIAAVPFQIWVPDVYQGAPTPVTAFLSVGSKAAGFVVLLRVLQPFLILPNLWRMLILIALLTLIYGNLAALPQNNLKRLLGYSSIAHAGYLMIGVACLDGRAVTFYLVAYLLMTLLSFAVLVIVAQHTGERIEDFDGLAQRSPFLAFAMLIAMASLAGVPLTVGFFGKFLVFMAAIAQHQTALIIVGTIGVACGFYYYLKVVRAMYWEQTANLSRIPISGLSRLAMSILIIGIISLGIYPQPILKALEPKGGRVMLASAAPIKSGAPNHKIQAPEKYQ